MKTTYIDANVLNLIDQIRDVNHMIDLHKAAKDNFMLNQYKARKQDFIKELVYELMKLDINTKDLFQFVRDLINQIEANIPEQEPEKINKKIHFSIRELKALTSL